MPRVAKHFALWVLAATAFIALLAVSFHDWAPSSEKDGSFEPTVLNRGLNGDPESLHPGNFSSNQASAVLRDLGEGLVVYSPTGQVSGGVAERWTISDDGHQYEFFLRPDARWSDGRPVQAENFVRAFQQLVDPSNGHKNANTIFAIKNAEAIVNGLIEPRSLGIRSVSERHLVINLEARTPHFLQILTHPSTFPTRSGVPAEISNGAYTLSKRVLGSQLELLKNTAYWNSENVAFQVVRYHIVDELVELSRFRAGELDITGNVPSGMFVTAKRDFPTELKVAPYLGVYYYGFNLANPKYGNNLSLRRALTLSIDRMALVSKVLGRGELPAFTWVPEGVSDYEQLDIAWRELDFDSRIAKARESLQDSGVMEEEEFSLRLAYNSSDVQERIALAIKAMWEEVLGIHVQLERMEFQVLLDEIQNNPRVELFRLSWTADYDDPESFLQVFRTNHPSNYTGYQNAQFDELMRLASRESDEERRLQLLNDAEKLLLGDFPVIPLYFYVSKHLVSERVGGWTANVLDIHQSQHLYPTSP